MKSRHVSFTGTRAGMTNLQKEMVWTLLQELDAGVLTHGDCVGADADAHALACRLGIEVRKRPSTVPGTQAGTIGGQVVAEPDEPLKRDRAIVDDGEVLIGCPDSKQEKQRSGTWYTMRYAWKQRKVVYVVFPDGGVVCGTTKEGCGPYEWISSRLVHIESEKDLDRHKLLICCGSCGYYFTHYTDRSKVKCPWYQCAREEYLDFIRKYYIAEEQLMGERLGAEAKRAIISFRGEYRWLSNFYDVLVVLDGTTYRATENAYQAAKTLDHEKRKAFVSASHAVSKKLGGEIEPLRSDWEEVKRDVMKDLLRQKFAVPELRDKLLATGSVELVEGNTWSDRYWGVDERGWNHLGCLLMQIRNDASAHS